MLGALLIAIGLIVEPSLSSLLLVAIGAAVVWQALVFYRATSAALVLTEEGLFDTNGAELARLDNIAKVDRGFFAFKPSNGFMILLKKPRERVWRPGLWWRFGRRVGVGGATSGKAARDMADVIAILQTDRGAELIASARADAKDQDKG